MMNIRTLSIACICLLMYNFIFSSCKTDEISDGIFDIAPKDLAIELDKESTTVYVPISSTLTINDWEVAYDASWITHGKKRNSLVLSFEANPNDTKRITSIKVTSPISNYTLTVTQYSKNDVVIKEEKDIKVNPTGGEANQEANSNLGIKNTWDGNTGGQPYLSTMSGTSTFPVTMEYFFTGNEVIDYAIYYPTSGKGAFGNVKVYAATAANANYTLQKEYDLQKKENATTIQLTPGLKPTKIKFEIANGMNDVVGCHEMEFYTKVVTLQEQLLSVFTDILCTELKPGVSDEAIAGLPAEYFRRIANSLKNNTYNEWEKDFRIQEYEAHSDIEVWAKKLKIRRYTDLDNPTGISVTPGEELIVLVGDTYGQNIFLQCIGEESTDYTSPGTFYLQPNWQGDKYPLKPGVNKITMKENSIGQLFLMYVTDISSPNAKPVKIHIPLGSGKVNGYFDLERHKTDAKYAELLSKATQKYFCIRGEKIMFYFHLDKLREIVKTKILPTIEFWDNLVKWEQDMSGISEIPANQMNNHIFAISPEGSYMWGGDRRIGFAKSTLFKVLVPEKVMSEKDNVWGPAHEIGHVLQGAINWPSTNESSNNVLASYVLYKLGKYGSNGSEISELANAYARKESWAKLGYGSGVTLYMSENTSLHMRMNWQLWNYFHRCGNMPDFFPKLFKELRATPLNASFPSMGQFDYAKAVCKVANMDMTEFFEKWGFFREVNIPDFNQYGVFPYIVLTPMIDQAKAYMASFPKKLPQPIYYLEDRKNGDVGIENVQVGDVGHYSQFKENAKIIGTPSYKLSGRTVTVNNGQQAVAFEARKGNENGELLYFFNFFTYTIPSIVTLDENTKFYAVQADGKRVEMRKE